MRWSVTVVAEGDRVVTREEVVALADAVAAHEGIASGIGTTTYGAQVVVEADTGEQAAEAGVECLKAAASEAGLPDWPVAQAEVIGEDEGYDEIPVGGPPGG